MKSSLVGFSGFVGSNLCTSNKFDGLYDSKNIKEAYCTEPDLLVYSGVPAQKFLANKFPEQDFKIIQGAINNIKNINPKKIVLISTIDVYNNPDCVDEDTKIEEEKLEPYGKNRYYLEKWVKSNYKNYLIIHLPALYGKNLKKNFIYDIINIIPSMLKKEKYEEIVAKDSFITSYFVLQDNGYYKIKNGIAKEELEDLKEHFIKLNFTALNFTDSRASYQFYNLTYLWGHIEKALKNNIHILNLAVEPVTAQELYEFVNGEKFINELNEKIPIYNFKTKYAELFNGKNGYIIKKEVILKDIRDFIKERK